MKSSKAARLFVALTITALAAVKISVLRAEETATISFGVVPQQSAAKLLRAWQPVLDYLGKKTGRRFSFHTAPDIPTFEARLARGEYDFAYMNPYHFTVFNDNPGYQAVARARDKQIFGILVVHKDAAINDPRQLHGNTLAFPAPAAFAATLVVQGELNQDGIGFESAYVNSHDSVYRAVAKKRFAAGGGVVRTFNLVDSSVRDNLRILKKTAGFTPHAIAAHPRIAPEFRQQVIEVLASIDEQNESPDVKQLLGIKGFVAAANDDWDDVRSLNLSQVLAR